MTSVKGYGYIALMQAVIDQAKRDIVRPIRKPIDIVNRDEAIHFLESDWCESMEMIINDVINPKSKNVNEATKIC